MRYRIIKLVVFFSLFRADVQAQQEIEMGRQIFISRCASCHAIDNRLIGPALRGVQDRRETSWIIDFVHSSQTMIKKGDPDAVALFTEYNKTVMPDHQDLSANQINSILAYIKDKNENTTAPTAGGSSSGSYKKPYKNKRSFIDKLVYLNFDKEQHPIAKDDYLSWLLIGIIVLVLVVFLHFMIFLKKVLSTYKKE